MNQKQASILDTMQRLAWKGGGLVEGCRDSPGGSVGRGERPPPCPRLNPLPLMCQEREAFSSVGCVCVCVCVCVCAHARTTPSSLTRATFQLPRNVGPPSELWLSQPGGVGTGSCCSEYQMQRGEDTGGLWPDAPWRPCHAVCWLPAATWAAHPGQCSEPHALRGGSPPPALLSYTRLTQENGRFRQFLKTTSARRTHPWARGHQFQEFSHLYSRTQVR